MNLRAQHSLWSQYNRLKQYPSLNFHLLGQNGCRPLLPTDLTINSYLFLLCHTFFRNSRKWPFLLPKRSLLDSIRIIFCLYNSLTSISANSSNELLREALVGAQLFYAKTMCFFAYIVMKSFPAITSDRFMTSNVALFSRHWRIDILPITFGGVVPLNLFREST